MRLLYTLLFYAATPLVLARLFWRGRREPAYRLRWRERLGRYSATPPSENTLWFHAVSVGEAEAAFPLIRALARRFPDHPILVTTTTPTGSARVRAVLGDSVSHVYLPYDLPDAVARFLAHFRPRLAVVLETEIWPNLCRACGARGIPLAIVNARLSERSAKGYAKLGGFTRDTLGNVRLIAAQTEADAGRFRAVGARGESVVVTGNIKFDMELPAGYLNQAAELRRSLFADRPVWVAASTHDGEEAQVLQAFAALRQRRPSLLLVLAPRHPPRFDGVAALCRAAGFAVRRRSLGESATEAGAEVFLLDTLGELRLFYAASDLAFVGGSLVPVGGHNVLEPALAGVPVLFGPHMLNFAEAGRRLREAGGALQVADGAELARRVGELLDDPARRGQMGERGKAFVDAGRGALRRVEDALAGLLAG
ncbi:MAG: lipid IV(A) 3-deoxy-D-manno-octulosonic acid transferase [Candidatus Methylumidiphilus sp.]